MVSPCWLSTITFILLLDLTCTRQIALLIIDVQNCFLPGGSLAVTEGDQVIPVINNIRSEYKADISLVVLSQDWHCSDHISFASQHKGAGQVIQLSYDKSANFSHNLTHEPSDLVVRKGYNCKVDSYSAFYDNGGFRHTELHDKLQEDGIDALIITGLARDYCVYYSAMDSKNTGKRITLKQDTILLKKRASNGQTRFSKDNPKKASLQDNLKQAGLQDNQKQAGLQDNHKQAGLQDNPKQAGLKDNNKQVCSP
ncbi:pncA [Mytilus edulis]|uniref:nicotinamidase n=1 Tax=Mytilus edulis TaxID=6550 RepID=A0A8S3QUA5_MYTED|nr:pncA [Mytilus edulis]